MNKAQEKIAERKATEEIYTLVFDKLSYQQDQLNGYAEELAEADILRLGFTPGRNREFLETAIQNAKARVNAYERICKTLLEML